MGAKTPTKLKLRRPTYKCDQCEKKFLSSQALKTHQYCSHKINANPKSKAKLVNLLGKSVRRAPVKQKINVDEAPEVSDVRKIEYECPHCFQRFSVYFSAFRHMQRDHGVESKGGKLSAQTGPKKKSELTKPVRIETCIKCNMKVRANEVHSCPNVTSSMISMLDMNCVCLGCQQTFPSILMFDLHISGLHSNMVESLFFPNIHMFTQWKEQMETQTQVKYLILGKCNFKQTYRCTFSPEDSSESGVQFCPSSIVVKEYSKSIQVHFYKEHHGHSCKYKLPDRFKKYLSTELLKKPITNNKGIATDEEDDLYEKFKTIIDSVALTAYNTDTDTLKLLYSKAIEMEKLLKTAEEPKATGKNMTDKQITDTLETMSNKKDEPPEAKRTKKDLDKPSLNTDGSRKKVKAIKDIKEVLSTPNLVSPKPCFNDSYKEFVDKITEKTKATNSDKSTPPKTTKKKIVKTKIGQFKPSVSPKVVNEEVEEKLEDTSKVEDTFKVEDTIKVEDTFKVEDMFVSPRLSLDSLKAKVEMDYEVVEQENDYNILILKI